MQTKINSVINLGMPSSAPDTIKNPEVRATFEAFILTVNNLLQAIEDYVEPTTKDITLWNSILPGATLLRHQPGRLYCKAFEDLSFGTIVNLFKSGGVLQARKAKATAGAVQKAYGYCNISSGVTAGNFTEIILSQGYLPITGVDCGQDLFLSAATPGAVTLTAPTGAGQLEQFIGVGVGLNTAYIDISLGQYIQH